MMSVVRPWLPAGALGPLPMERALQPVVDRWAVRWFVDCRVDASCRPEGRSAISPVERTIRKDGPASGFLGGSDKRALLELALGASLEGPPLGDGDHRLLDAFAFRIVEDLIVELDAALDREASRDGDRLAMSLVARGSRIVQFELPVESVVGLVKGHIGRRAPVRLPVSRDVALSATRVRIEALLGRARLVIGEIGDLAPGDVLVLDRPLDAKVDLRLAEAGRIFAAGKLDREQDKVIVRI